VFVWAKAQDFCKVKTFPQRMFFATFLKMSISVEQYLPQRMLSRIFYVLLLK
jgi:hypothetical protein